MSGKGAKGLSGKGAKGTMGDKKGDKKKPISRSARAGLQFPVGRIHRLLKVWPAWTLRLATLLTLLLPDFASSGNCDATHRANVLNHANVHRAECQPTAVLVPQLQCTPLPSWVRALADHARVRLPLRLLASSGPG